MKKISILLFFIIFGSGVLLAQTEFEKQVKNLYSKYSEGLENNITVLGIKKADDIRYWMLLSKDEDSKKPIFQIGSITKLFIAHSLAQLSVEGKMDIDRTLSESMPYLEFEDKRIGEITLLQLANHTSGLPRLPVNLLPTIKDSLQPYENYEVNDLTKFLTSYQLTRDPGHSYEYSNLGYGILGHILDEFLEKTEAMSLEEYIEENIFKPIEMKNTTTVLSEEQMNRLTTPFSENTEVPAWNFQIMKWAGGYYSNAEDMMMYINQFTTDIPVYDENVLNLMTEITRDVNATMKMAMGWHVSVLENGEQVYWHNGGTYGNFAFIGFVENSGNAVVILSNSNRVLDGFAMQLLENL